MAKTLKNDEVAQNDLNIKLKGLPWYQDFLHQAGQDPNRVKLNDAQRKQLTAIAAQNGVQLPKGVQFDPSGNVNEQHGFAGQPGWAKALEIAAVAAPAAIAAAPAIGSALGIGGTAGGVTSGVAGMTVPELGIDAIPSVLGKVGKIAQGGSVLGKVSNILGAVTPGINSALSASANNRGEAEDRQYRAAALNMQGAQQQALADKEARANLYRASVLKNPTVSEYNTRGVPTFSPEMMEGYSNFEKAALQQAVTAPNRKPFEPYKPDYDMSTLEKVGSYASPALSTFSAISKYL